MSYLQSVSKVVKLDGTTPYTYGSFNLIRFNTFFDFATLQPPVQNILSCNASYQNFHINVNIGTSIEPQFNTFWLMDYGVETNLIPNSSGNSTYVKINGWIQYTPQQNFVMDEPLDNLAVFIFTLNIVAICE